MLILLLSLNTTTRTNPKPLHSRSEAAPKAKYKGKTKHAKGFASGAVSKSRADEGEAFHSEEDSPAEASAKSATC